MNYEVTIGIPVYNAEKYIRQTLDSALAQTFQSIEFLVLDDCGTDGSMAVVREYQQTHPRGKDIRIVSQPRNMGIGHGRNRIIDETRGAYLLFLDADDELPPQAVERLWQTARQYQAQLVYGSHERIIDYDGKTTVEVNRYDDRQFDTNDDLCQFAYDEYGRIPAMVWKYLIDIRVYRDHHLRFPNANFWEDFAMTIDLPTYVERAAFVSDIVYRYYSRYGTLSNNQERQHIDKQEILKTAVAIGRLKGESGRLRSKPYYLKRCLKLMKTLFFMVCYVLKNERIISPSFTARELRDMMRSPLSWRDVIGLDKWHLSNLLFVLLGKLPPSMSVFLVRQLGRRKGLV